ncbi:MAG: Gfo/Idh/MocA family oxidoreductase [Actinocatenispora sp.]
MASMRYGVVGGGRVFQRYHLPCVRERDDVSLVAVCDTDPDQARRTLGDGHPDVLVTDDLTEFLDRGRPDVVAVCTPNDSHTAPTLAALAAGAAVLCEKPLAATGADAARIAAAAAESRLFGVNLPYRFHPLIPAFVSALPTEPHEVTLTFTTAGQRLWRPVTRWYSDEGVAGGGALLDLGLHAIDLLTAIFGTAEPAGCQLDRPGVEERAVAHLRFGTTPATLRIDRASRTMAMLVEARGADGAVALDLRRGEVHTADGTITAEPGHRPELAAIDAFLDAATGRGGAVVGAADALAHQSLVTRLYEQASVEPEPVS